MLENVSNVRKQRIIQESYSSINHERPNFTEAVLSYLKIGKTFKKLHKF